MSNTSASQGDGRLSPGGYCPDCGAYPDGDPPTFCTCPPPEAERVEWPEPPDEPEEEKVLVCPRPGCGETPRNQRQERCPDHGVGFVWMLASWAEQQMEIALAGFFEEEAAI